MHRAAPALLAAIMIALVAAFNFARAATDCVANPCVYVPMIRAASAPSGVPTPTLIAAPTRTPTSSPTPTRDPELCAAEYPTVCIPPPPPDLDCTDIAFRNFTVLPPDRHRFDRNGDQIGCEQP